MYTHTQFHSTSILDCHLLNHKPTDIIDIIELERYLKSPFLIRAVSGVCWCCLTPVIG